MSGDWAELNTDLLHLILQKLENFSNFIRFRSVCKGWRSAVGPTEYFPHLPWILYPANGNNQSDYVIYSLSSKTTCQINLPKNNTECRKYFRNAESANGFLLLKHNVSKSPYLFNPLTETKIYPPLSKDDSIFFILYMGLHLNGTLRTINSGVRLVFCELLVDIIRTSKSKLQVGLWKYDNNFINFEIPFLSGNMAYYKGKLFVYSSQTAKTRIFDINTRAEIGIPIPDTVGYLCIQYLLVAIGDLFRVVMKSVTGDPYKFQFNVYRLEHTCNFEQCRWMELKGIGDRILFLGLYHGFATAFCLSASVVNGLKGNCIYYLHYYHVLRYNMEDGTTDRIYRYPAPSARWFMPNLI